MNFEQALHFVRNGAAVRRGAWERHHLFVWYRGSISQARNPRRPDALPLAYIELVLGNDTVMPWTPTVTDILAVDWMEVKDAVGEPRKAPGVPAQVQRPAGAEEATGGTERSPA